MKKNALLFLVFVAPNLFAQTNCACCDTHHGQFDFWIGEWNVFDTMGNQIGESKIMKTENNCLVLEKWKGGSGVTGTSMNFFDSSDSTWNQLWVDNTSSILRLKGHFVSGKMILKSEGIKGQKLDIYFNQISWFKNQNGSVTQVWEIIDKDGQLLRLLFKGIYQPKNE